MRHLSSSGRKKIQELERCKGKYDLLPEIEVVAGFDIEVMKVVRVKLY